MLRKKFGQFVSCFLHATTEGSNYDRYDRNSIPRSSFSHLKSKLSISRVSLSVRFVSMFCCIGHAMSQIQICFSFFSSSIKSGLLAVSVFLKSNWKSQTSFALSFSNTIPRSHRSLYHIVSAPINSYSLAQGLQVSSALCYVSLNIHY